MKKWMFLLLFMTITALPALAANESEAPGAATAKGPAPISPIQQAQGDVLGSFSAPGSLPVGAENDGNGNLLITDISGDTVYLIDTTGGIISSFSVAAQSGNPIGVTTDGTNIYVGDTDGDDIDIYTTAGTYVSSFSVASETDFPEGITYNPVSNTLLVVDGDGTPNDHIMEYSLAGTLINNTEISTTSTDGIAYDPNRCCYWVYDSGSDSVTQYDLDLNVIDSFPGTVNAGFSAGEGVAVVGNSLYVVAASSVTIVEFDISDAANLCAPTTVPTLNQWGMILLVLLFASAAFIGLNKKIHGGTPAY